MDDIYIEIDDRGDADTILAALNFAAAASYRSIAKAAGPALAEYHRDTALRYDRLATRFQGALDPEPEPPDFEPEPPLPKDDPDYNGAELLQIRRQSRVSA